MLKSISCLILYVILGSMAFPYIPMTYVININHSIRTPMEYNKSILRFADENDTVIIRVNSNGGYVHYGNGLVNSMLRSRAKTISINEGMAASMAGIIALAADDIRSEPMAQYLFHAPRYINPDGSHEIVGKDTIDYELFDRTMKAFVDRYLTEDERKRLRAGEDVSVIGPDLIKRIRDGNSQN